MLACLGTLFFSPLYLVLSLRYRQLRLLAIVLVVLFLALLSLIRHLSPAPAVKNDGAGALPA